MASEEQKLRPLCHSQLQLCMSVKEAEWQHKSGLILGTLFIHAASVTVWVLSGFTLLGLFAFYHCVCLSGSSLLKFRKQNLGLISLIFFLMTFSNSPHVRSENKSALPVLLPWHCPHSPIKCCNLPCMPPLCKLLKVKTVKSQLKK